MRIKASKAALAVLIFARIMNALSVCAAAPTLTLAEQAVIEALLPQESASKKYVIEERTSISMLQSDHGALQLDNAYDTFANPLREEAKDRDKAFKEALEDFLKKNKTPVQIVFPTNALKNVELVSDATVNGFFAAKHNVKPDGWDAFYRRFPDSGGLITISRVGFDPAGTVALIYLGEQSHYRSGQGRIRVLRREGGKWIFKASERIGPEWVS